MNAKVFHIGQIGELAAKWEEARKCIFSGRIKGFQLSVLRDDGSESVYVAGDYKDNPRLATRAALRMSAARALIEDDPPALTGTD